MGKHEKDEEDLVVEADRPYKGKHCKDFDELIEEAKDLASVVGEVIDLRVQVYGDPVVAFTEIAELWSTYLGFRVQAHQVPMMQLLMKVQRSKTSPDYSDHSDDIEGYLDIFRKVIGEDMIHARTVNDYIEQKWPRSDA